MFECDINEFRQIQGSFNHFLPNFIQVFESLSDAFRLPFLRGRINLLSDVLKNNGKGAAFVVFINSEVLRVMGEFGEISEDYIDDLQN